LLVILFGLMSRHVLYATRLNEELREYAVWYLAPEWLFAVALASVGIAGLLERPWPRLRWSTHLPTLATAVLVVLAIFAEFPSRLSTPSDAKPEEWKRSVARIAALKWSEANLPEDAVLGAFNSGILHFYATDIKVANLDGRVDDGTFVRLKEQGLGTDTYVRQRGVTHILDTWIDGGYWRNTVSRGTILHEVKYGRQNEHRIVVVELP
jgi:hypothetical protein